MHELSIALSIVDVVTEEIDHRRGRVVAVHLKLGPLSGVLKDALVLAYCLAREGTLLEQAALVVEEVPIVAFCPTCAAERTLASVQELCCPTCAGAPSEIVHGRELEVVALEVES
jgi:hydrogenase nickel incorporation protein HypA/HybF